MDNWSQHEKEEYKKIRKKKMGSFYAEVNISLNNPSRRLEYVIGRLLESKDIEDLEEMIKKYGKPKTLKKLEKRFLNKYF